MSEDHVELYWMVWVSKEEDGDSFHFLKYLPKDKEKGKGKGKARMEEEQSGEEQEQEIGREQDEEDFQIDQGIFPYPMSPRHLWNGLSWSQPGVLVNSFIHW